MKKKLFGLFLVSLVFFAYSTGQAITPIADVQDTTGTGSDASAMLGQSVTIEGIVTAESWAFGNSYYFVQDAEAMWSGIKVYDSGRGNAYGDSVRITGTVDEYYNVTEITDVIEYVKLDSGKSVDPILVNTEEVGTGGSNAEAYEGVLVQVSDAEITNADLGYGEWELNDGTGACRVDDAADYYFDPAQYDSVRSLTGVLEYSYSNFKVLPRLAYDIIGSGGFTRLQRIQQVRHSDLLKTPQDGVSDISYLDGDTISVTGVVTMPTGLSFAGAGIKFIFSDTAGGPWSAILSYNEDSTAYPTLYEGDIIEMTGYIGEYTTGSSNMTEFWITSPIQITNIGQDLPPVDTINTGDLRLPATAEQWGNVIVAVKDAEVINVNPQYELFSVDDGTGEILIDDDSDSLEGYVDPPVGALFESISGWVYHHYGSYADSSTYKLEPLYVDDLVLGSGPPQLTDVSRDPGVPLSTDAVSVEIDVTTNAEIDSVTIFYTVDGGDLNYVNMSNTKGDIYTGQIPAQANGSFVEYYIQAFDNNGMSSFMPADTSAFKYGYIIRDEGLSIYDIQYSPWHIANSPFNECHVSVSGIVTVDTSFNNAYEAYTIQDGSGAWNGVCVFGITELLQRGDEIKVYGAVSENNPDWTYKWGNNTVILADSIEVLSEGNTLPEPVELTTAELSNDTTTAEQYEGVLVSVNDVQVTALNTYDWSVDDGTGSCLIDDDAAPSDLAAWFDTLAVGHTMTQVTGPFIFSFGTYKITPRDLVDVSVDVGFAENPITEAYAYRLKQNYPNPFNPDTRIYFEIPRKEHVSIQIYNILGQRIRSLTRQEYSAGQYVLNWDGRNDSGELVSSGTYILRMKAGNHIDSKKMLLIR